MSTKSKRPYLLRALYDWIVDSNLTPYVLVNAHTEGVNVPAGYVKDGKIVLNVAPHAVQGLTIDGAALACNCRFRGNPFAVYLPMASIEAIYARETGEGMAFEAEPPDPDSPPDRPDADDGGDSSNTSGGGHLKVVK